MLSLKRQVYPQIRNLFTLVFILQCYLMHGVLQYLLKMNAMFNVMITTLYVSSVCGTSWVGKPKAL